MKETYWVVVIPFGVLGESDGKESAHSAACDILETMGYLSRVMQVDADAYEAGERPGAHNETSDTHEDRAAYEETVHGTDGLWTRPTLEQGIAFARDALGEPLRTRPTFSHTDDPEVQLEEQHKQSRGEM